MGRITSSPSEVFREPRRGWSGKKATRMFTCSGKPECLNVYDFASSTLLATVMFASGQQLCAFAVHGHRDAYENLCCLTKIKITLFLMHNVNLVLLI